MTSITKYLSSIGRKGGKATGDRKRRSTEHYQEMARKSEETRRLKAVEKKEKKD